MEALTKIPRITAVLEVKRLRNLYDGVESRAWTGEFGNFTRDVWLFSNAHNHAEIARDFRMASNRNLASETWVLKDIVIEF